MHRIDTSTAQVDKFGAGKNGFTGGNPQTGELPTALDADYFDTLQEELAGVIEAAGITLNKANNSQLLAAIKALVGNGRLLNIKTFTSSGSYTPTTGTKKIRVKIWGGGGGGGGCAANATAGAAGGAAGGYTESLINVSNLTFPLSVTVGVGGTAAAAGANAGGAGGTSTFGSILSATGGAGGGGASGSTAGQTPGSVGVGSGGNIINVTGTGSSTAAGTIGSTGGSTYSSGGGVGHVTAGAGGGGFPGGGGGGANGASSATPGGAGATGMVIIEEYA